MRRDFTYDFPVVYLNSNDGTGLLAFGHGERIKSQQGGLDALQDFITQQKGSYIFGYLAYDLKNEIENLSSSNDDEIEFPELFFWRPEHVIHLKEDLVEFVQGAKNKESFEFLNRFIEEEIDENFHPYPISFEPTLNKQDYLEKINKIKEHIQLGDVYELCFCQEYQAKNVNLEYPIDAYFKLNTITQAPYSSFMSFDEFSIFCGSPECFLQKKGNQLVSKPIKGTAKRGETIEEDIKIKTTLKNDPKERAENVMIVDLIRNDFSRIATPKSVNVDELFGIYSYRTVHQLISTISCELRGDLSFIDILRATFPMGSMTGAPKVKAMQLIEKYENFKRGVFSGTIGYINPNGDFEFNVVIRTLLYNHNKQVLSCGVGGAITIHSDPEKEYQECLTKVGKIFEGLNEDQ